MQRRQEEARHEMVLREFENLSNAMGDKWSLSPGFKKQYLRGAGELELVRSGLDDTMRSSFQSMREIWHERKDVTDLRTAAYLVSIGKVAASYQTKGL
jgi:glutamate dehydrogenase (NAD(P)+)